MALTRVIVRAIVASRGRAHTHGAADRDVLWLLVKGPHAQDMRDMLVWEDFVDESVLVVDASGVTAGEITDQLRWSTDSMGSR